MPSSAVTWRSSMASRSAAWVLGGARLISSPSSRLVNTGPGPELEARGALVEDRRAGDVGGQQVGRELHAAEAKPGRGGERARDQRLGHPGDVLEQDVAVGQQREQHELEDVALADHGALDLVEDRLGRGGDVARMRRAVIAAASRGRRARLAARRG